MPEARDRAVQGYCLGQGAEIVAVCDLAIAADDARFGEVQINLGATPPIFAAPPNMTIKHLKEYLLTGEQISAHKAQGTSGSSIGSCPETGSATR